MSIRHFFALLMLMLLGFWSCSPSQSDSGSSDADSSATNESLGAKMPSLPDDLPKPTTPEKKSIPAPPPPPILKELGLKTTGGIGAESPDYQWMYDCVAAARTGNYDALQAFIAPQKGLYFLHRPGVATSIEWVSQAVALKRFSWNSWVMQYGAEKKPPLKETPIYLAEPFKVVPEWQELGNVTLPPLASEVKGRFDYFPKQVEALVEYGFMAPKPDERKRLDEVPELVEMELLLDWVYYYFGRVAGEWRLIGLDVARCDFSA